MPPKARSLDLYRFGAAGCRRSLRELHALLEHIDHRHLEELVEEALELAERATDMEDEWAEPADGDRQTRDIIDETNDAIDETLTGLYKVLDTSAELAHEVGRGRMARQMRNALFPDRVYPLTSARLHEQHMLVRELVDRMNGAFAEHVEALNLERVADRLDTLDEMLGEQLDGISDGDIGLDDLHQAHRKCHEAYDRVVSVLQSEELGDPEMRQELLAPLAAGYVRLAR